MITGHLTYPRSTAPSMDFASLRVAIPWSLKEKPGRLALVGPSRRDRARVQVARVAGLSKP